MSKKVLLASPEVQKKATSNQNTVATNWSLCALCQKETAEKLECPSNLKRKGYSSTETYNKIAQNILELHNIGHLPDQINTNLFDENNLSLSFITNSASFHKNCKNKFNDLKIDRAKKRSATSDTTVPEVPKKITRRSISSLDIKDNCFFCNKDEGILHKVTTYRLDRRVRKCAFMLQDTVLLTKLSEGDMIALDAVYHKNCLTNLYKTTSLDIENYDYHDPEKEAHGVA